MRSTMALLLLILVMSVLLVCFFNLVNEQRENLLYFERVMDESN